MGEEEDVENCGQVECIYRNILDGAGRRKMAWFWRAGGAWTCAWDDMGTLQMSMVGTSTWREGLRDGALGRSDKGLLTVVFSDLDNWLYLKRGGAVGFYGAVQVLLTSSICTTIFWTCLEFCFQSCLILEL